MNPTRLHAIMSGEARDLKARLARLAMSCAEPFYRGAVAVRNAMFDLGIRKPKKLPRPVISIGNITTGGTGKTPMVIEVVRRLVAMGHKPAVLLRGYAGAVYEQTQHSLKEGTELPTATSMTGPDPMYWSDETEILRGALNDLAPVEANPSRMAGAERVLRYAPQTTLFLLDDGFQHRQVARDLNIVLVDATEPFGFEHVLPRGLLREKASNLKRADAVVITRSDQARKYADLPRRIERLSGKPPIAQAAHVWTGWQRGDLPSHGDLQGIELNRDIRATTRSCPLDELRHQRVAAFCGIGNPDAFHATLRSHVGTIVDFHAFRDHFGFGDHAALRGLVRSAAEKGAQAIVMTEKDWVKWPVTLNASLDVSLPVYRPVLDIKFLSGGDAIDRLLRQIPC